jgi:hypothetical protein
VEDITALDSGTIPAEDELVVGNMRNNPDEALCPRGRPPATSRDKQQRKNDNWSDADLQAALAAEYNGGLSMKKASEEYNIPYSSFREHCYGVRTS